MPTATIESTKTVKTNEETDQTTDTSDDQPKLRPSFVIATATDVQQNFSKYTKIAASGKDVVIQKNGKSIARIIAERKGKPLLTDFIGILSDMPHMSTKDVYEERRKIYEATGRL